MLLYCLKVLKTLLPLTLLLLILCLTVSSLVPFILQQIALNNNSFYLATSLDFFTLAISGFFFFFFLLTSVIIHTANAFVLQASDFSFFFRFGYGFCQHLWYLIVPDVLFNLWCCIIWDKRSSIRPVF